MLNSSYILVLLSGNLVYGHAIEITIGLVSYANMSIDFLDEALIRAAVTFFRLQNMFKGVMKVRS